MLTHVVRRLPVPSERLERVETATADVRVRAARPRASNAEKLHTCTKTLPSEQHANPQNRRAGGRHGLCLAPAAWRTSQPRFLSLASRSIGVV